MSATGARAAAEKFSGEETLSKDAQRTFFRQEVTRATRFGMELVETTFDTEPSWGATRRIILKSSTLGDCVIDSFVRVKLPTLQGGAVWKEPVALRVIKATRLVVGGAVVEDQGSDFVHAWNQLSMPDVRRAAYDEMTHQVGGWCIFPLHLFFCGNTWRALPLHLLEGTEVAIELDFARPDECIHGLVGTPGPLGEVRAFCTAIRLDIAEKKAIVRSTYYDIHIETPKLLVVEVHGGSKVLDVKLDQRFNVPIHELIWTFQSVADAASAVPFTASNPFDSIRLLLPTGEAISDHSAPYYYAVQPFRHHARTPSPSAAIGCLAFSSARAADSKYGAPDGMLAAPLLGGVRMYFTPSNAASGFPSGTLRIWALGANVFRAHTGQGGLLYV